MRSNYLLVVLVLCVLLLVSTPAWAATQNATVYGTVYDASGNPIPNVTVVLDNGGLGFSRTTTTGSDGSYNFAEVPPAEGYSITAIRDSRKIDIRSGIVINVGDERVIFPPLKEQVVAAASEVVERKVESSTVQNETVSTAISGVVTGDQLRELPLYNRTFLALGGLTPNVHDLAAGNELAGASFSVAGSRGSNNAFLLDGADNVASSTNQAVPFQVNDAVQEFRLTSSTAPAEYGRNRGGVVNVVTRRGGNAFHGSAFGYFANDALNADSPLSVYNGTTFDKAAAYAGPVMPAGFATAFPSTYNQYVATAEFLGRCTDAGAASCNTTFNPAALLATNHRFKSSFDSKQFGANAGGALIKDKLFVFGSYEGTRIDNPNSVFERVPSQFDKTYAPYGVTPYYSSTSPDYVLAQQVLDLYPAANVVAIPGVLEFYRGEAPNYTNVHNFLIRSDVVPTDKDSLTFRFVLQKLNQLHDATLPPSSNYPGNGAYRDALNQNFNANYTRTFSANMLNEFRAGYSRFNVSDAAQDAGFNASSIFGYSQLPTFMLNGLDSQYAGGSWGDPGVYSGWLNWLESQAGLLPPMMAPTLDNKFPFARMGAPLSAPTSRVDTTVFFGDSVSWNSGKHSIKFGADVRRLTNSYFDGGVARGWVFSGNIGEFVADSATQWRTLSYTWPSFDFAQRQGSPYAGDFTNWAFAGYLQDTWRVHPRVTVNLGLRFERIGNPTEAQDRIWNFDPAADGLVQAGSTQVVSPYGLPCAATAPYSGLTAYQQTQFNFDAFSWGCTATGNGAYGKAANVVAPRVGLAWDLFGDAKTVLRLGFGMYYDQTPTDNYAKLLYNRPVTSPNAVYGQTLDSPPYGYCSAVIGGLLYQASQCGSGNRVLDFGTWANNPAYAPYDLASFPLGIYSRDLKYQQLPRTYQVDATLQHQLFRNMSVEAGYVGALGRDLPVIYNANFAGEFGNLASAAANDANAFFPVWTLTNRGESNYHSLMARLRVADFHGLRLNAAYSWSKALDNASASLFPATAMALNNVVYASLFSRYDVTGYCLFNPNPSFTPAGTCAAAAGAPLQVPTIDLTPPAVTTTGQAAPQVTRYLIPQDPFNFLRDDYGPSDFDGRHRFVLDYTWELPFRSNSVLLKNWLVSGIFTAQSGQPFTIFAGPIAGEITQRANLSGPVTIDPTNPNAAISMTNLSTVFPSCRAAAVYPQSPFMPDDVHACAGNSGRNAFVGDKFMNLDLAVQKGFAIFGEGRMLTFRTEFFNLLNRSNFYNPISQLSTDGTSLNPNFGTIKSAHNARQIQFAVRFTW